jgi:hypothetical protein
MLQCCTLLPVCLSVCSDLLLQCRANKSRDEVNSGKSAFFGNAPWSQVILILILILVGRKSLSPYIPHVPQGMTSTVPRCRAGVLSYLVSSLSRYGFLEPRPSNTYSPCKSSKGPWVSNIFLLSLSLSYCRHRLPFGCHGSWYCTVANWMWMLRLDTARSPVLKPPISLLF